MKESNTLAGNAANNFLRREIWLDTKEEYMKELDLLAEDATMKPLQKEALLNT